MAATGWLVDPSATYALAQLEGTAEDGPNPEMCTFCEHIILPLMRETSRVPTDVRLVRFTATPQEGETSLCVVVANKSCPTAIRYSKKEIAKIKEILRTEEGPKWYFRDTDW